MFEHRLSDSPYIQLMWRFLPSNVGTYIHNATEYWSFFFKVNPDVSHVYISGPATVPREFAYVASEVYWGIVLRAHVFMPSLTKKDILNMNIELPVADEYFRFNDKSFAIPTYDAAESFIDLLVEKRCIVADQIVAQALEGATRRMADRTVQRHVAQTTGLTRQKMQSIQRARSAFILLQKGVSISEVVSLAGYADQPHLTKSLKLLAGHTPAQILSDYKTSD